MKKTLFVFLTLTALFFPTYAQEAEAAADASATAAVKEKPIVSKQAKEEAKKAKKTAKQAKKEQKKAARADKKRQKNERTDALLGVVYLPVSNYSVKDGNVLVSLRGGTGSFNVAAVPEKGSPVSVLSSADDSSTSYFSVLVDGYEYRLNHDAGVVPEVRQLEDCGQIAYTLEKRLQVVVSFTPLSSALDTPADMVRLMVYVTSLANKPQTVAVKALFDTVLGENTNYHFYTGGGLKIEGGKQFLATEMDAEKWIISTNGKTFVQFLLAGPTISPIEAVSIANRDDLYRARWIPIVSEAKGFNGVLAYNNSAIAVSWPQFELAPEKTEIITMYMVLSANGEEPQGQAFLSAQTVDTVTEEPALVQETKTDFVVKNPNVEFVVPPITDRQLDPAYVQALINRINNLQSDPNLVDRTEVRRLNAELDAILEKIRQQQQ